MSIASSAPEGVQEQPESTTAKAPPAWAVKMRRINTLMMEDIGGGPRVIKLAWVINTQKAGTFLFLGALMWLYAGITEAATSMAAWVYLALHGSYGIVWLIKDVAFPDKNWQVRATYPASLSTLTGLALYWSFGWLLISGTAQPVYPVSDAAWFCLCSTLVIVGSAIMIAADAQKHFTLMHKRGLITSGMFRYVRHPNYLGEMMLYLGFALMVMHPLPFLVLAFIWGCLFSTNMAMKEASMSRYPEWADYKRRSWWLVPGIF